MAKIKNSDKLIEQVRESSGNMSMDEYAKATGIDKEVIFDILKGKTEEVDEETLKRLSLKH